MLKTFFLGIFLISSIHLSGQEEASTNQEIAIDEFNQLMNYVPKALLSDPISLTFHKKHKLELNTLGQLKTYYGLLQQFNAFSKEEISLMEERINQLAVAFYLENKPILIEETGGYSGCSDKWLLTKNIKGKEITILRFCYSCIDDKKFDRKLIHIFNHRTEQLLYNNESSFN